MCTCGGKAEAKVRMYPDQGLRKVEGEFRSTLVEMVQANFPKMTRGR